MSCGICGNFSINSDIPGLHIYSLFQTSICYPVFTMPDTVLLKEDVSITFKELIFSWDKWTRYILSGHKKAACYGDLMKNCNILLIVSSVFPCSTLTVGLQLHACGLGTLMQNCLDAVCWSTRFPISATIISLPCLSSSIHDKIKMRVT